MTAAIIKVHTNKNHAQGWLEMGPFRMACALGKNGLATPEDAVEGDSATPMGHYRLTEGFWRADKMEKPRCQLPLTAIDEHMGWCDDPRHPLYNQQVRLPFADSHETLWRADNRYDLLFVLDFNRKPITPGRGSAIFLHVTDDDLPPTRGCIALKLDDLLTLADHFSPDQHIVITSTAA